MKNYQNTSGSVRAKQFSLLIAVLVTVFMFSCKKPLVFGAGSLGFSEDTVRFDTIFSGFDSPTERLIVTNREKNPVKIDEIFIEGGPISEFSMIVDGIESQSITDYELRADDSLIIFIKMTSNLQDAFAEDKIIFKSGDFEQSVRIETWVFDKIEYTSPKDSIFVLPCNTTWTNTKKIVIDGFVVVPPGCTLTIDPATEIYFTGRKDENFNLISSLVIQGTIQVNGMPGAEVLFTSSRFGERYEENPAQWRGIWIFKTSEDSYIKHALIKNALFGVEVDSVSNNTNPKLKLENTEIRNMAGYGVWGLGFKMDPLLPSEGPMVLANNCLIHNCQEANVGIFGGGYYSFNNCTMANYSLDFGRKTSQIGIQNWIELESGGYQIYQCFAEFKNCLIWGSEEEEVTLDSFPTPGQFLVTFDNCLIRSTAALNGSDNIFNQDPQFVDPKVIEAYDRDYHLEAGSPAINMGKNTTAYFDDLEGTIRDTIYDIGAYEYVE